MLKSLRWITGITASGPTPLLSQYRAFSTGAIALRIELVAADGTSFAPATVNAAANAAHNLADLAETDAQLAAAWPQAVGALVTNDGASVVYVNTGARPDGTLVSDPSAQSGARWNPGETHAIGLVG